MKKILLIILVLFVSGAGIGYYMYNKPVADTNDLEAAYSVSADELFTYFENNEEEANKKYLGKILEVKGMVRDLSLGDSGELNLVLASTSEMFGVNCGITKDKNSSYSQYKPGDSITVKGECTGISMDVVLTRCVIVK